MITSVNPTSQRITKLLEGKTDEKEETEILDLLTQADSVTLNQTMGEVNLPKLFASVDDHWRGPKNKTSLLKLLSEDRLDELATPARASIITGLQKESTEAKDQGESPAPQASRVDENAIGHILLGTRSTALTDLKNSINAGADAYDMHHLLHRDVHNPTLLRDIYGHIQSEAQGHATGQIKPLSDIDDTFYLSHNDTRYPDNTVYPGVLAFYDELDRGNSESKPDPLGDLTFLTARPDEPSGTLKERTHRMLRANGVKEASVLLGSVGGLIDNESMARKKMENFQEYLKIYPEYSYAFAGDSGQGDPILAERLVAGYPNQVKGVFIHNVTDLSPEQKEAYAAKGIRVYDTYVGAAVEAHKLGLISSEGLKRVAEATQSDLAKVPFTDEQQRQAREADLQRDLMTAQSLLPSH